MENNKNIQDKIDNFLKENKINVKGGTITSEKQLSSVLNDLAMSDLKKGKIEKALYFTEKAIEFYEENHYSYFIKGLAYRQWITYPSALNLLRKPRHRTVALLNRQQ